MICDLKYTLGLYKQGKITDLVLSRSLTDHVSAVASNVKVKVLRPNIQCSGGQLCAMQTIPERKYGKFCSTIFIDQRLVDAMDPVDFIENLHAEVKNNIVYLKIFTKFLMKNRDTRLDRAEVMSTLLSMYLISNSQMNPAIAQKIFKSGASFIDPANVSRYIDMLNNGQCSFSTAVEYLEVRGLPHWIANCCDVIAKASGIANEIFDISYHDFIPGVSNDINNLNKLIITDKNDTSKIEDYLAGPGVHTKINNASDVVSKEDFIYPNKSD